MSKSALLDFIPDSRRKVVYHEEDGKTYIETRQDVSHILKAVEAQRDRTPDKDFRHVAFIPEETLNRAMVEGWFNDPAAWKRWANDPDNRIYRTWEGRI